ncbi:MAG: hypothetical protein P8O78_07755 [Flavobacteriaceae bacterium]|nr:hypothetical protein [Flavobacteriaceae bacterium]
MNHYSHENSWNRKNYVNHKDEISTYKSGKQIIFSKPESSLVFNNEDVAFPSITENPCQRDWTNL